MVSVPVWGNGLVLQSHRVLSHSFMVCICFTDLYFIPVSCFLLFNLCDWAGRSLTAICMWVSLIARAHPWFYPCGADTASCTDDRYYIYPLSIIFILSPPVWTNQLSCLQPQKDSVLLPVSILCRLAFVPLFMLCNVQPRLHMPVFFHHDGFFIVFMIVFAFSNGYLASLCMCYGPK